MMRQVQSARESKVAAEIDPGSAQGGASGAPPFGSEQRDAMEQLSQNLARAAFTAQSAMLQAVSRQPGQALKLNTDPMGVAPAMAEVMGGLASHPDRLMRAQAELFAGYMNLWSAATLRALGERTAPVASPDKSDKRFKDPDWSANPVFDILKQSYLLTSGWMNALVGGVEDVDPEAKRRVEFFTKMLTDAFSPSNFLLSNPAALKAALESKGESLVRGAEQFARDMERGGGQLAISLTDVDRFEVGVDVATAPGKVVYRNRLFELLQFSPTTETVHEVPLLIFPPWINKYYILDLRPENSMIRWLTGQGFTVFVTAWVNPGPELKDVTFEDYVREGAFEAIAQVKRQCATEQVHAVGYCIGGTMLSTALALMAQEGEGSVASVTFFAAQQDFSEAGDLLLFTNDAAMAGIESRMDAAGGVLPGMAMADTFNMLRANDLIWSPFVNNYLLGKAPTAFDLLFWNSDQTRMPKTLHLFYLENFYRQNRLAKGELELAGRRLSLGDVTVPVFAQAAEADHIAPYRSVYRGLRLFGGPVTFMLAGSGHIAGVVNPPGAQKYQHWIHRDEHLPDTVEAWRANADEFPGSWWPRWMDWLKPQSGGQVPARDPAAGPLEVLGDAPGEYVKVRS
ncbi:MAG: class I poly(R)-hydroxyalkanoic acid synthase [Proteobacteria bacterium]|nr:class I poly(R)-hydroxyalkanoic acid synthase [Pseudomonadota bacterium]